MPSAWGCLPIPHTPKVVWKVEFDPITQWMGRSGTWQGDDFWNQKHDRNFLTQIPSTRQSSRKDVLGMGGGGPNFTTTHVLQTNDRIPILIQDVNNW